MLHFILNTIMFILLLLCLFELFLSSCAIYHLFTTEKSNKYSDYDFLEDCCKALLLGLAFIVSLSGSIAIVIMFFQQYDMMMSLSDIIH